MVHEIELRSILTDGEYDRLRRFFDEHTAFEGESDQETHYLEAAADLRIQRGTSDAKMWLKKGKLHDESREEFEVHFAPTDFPMLRGLLAAAGHGTKVVWIRRRRTYAWDGVTVCLDDTKGFAKILELELLSEKEGEGVGILRRKLDELGIAHTPREVFDEKYHAYLKDWRARLSWSAARSE